MNLFLILAFALAWLAILAGCWPGWQLLRQNGRLLLRLEALEQRLDELTFDEPSSSQREEADSSRLSTFNPQLSTRSSEPRYLGCYKSFWQALASAQQDQARWSEGGHAGARLPPAAT